MHIPIIDRYVLKQVSTPLLVAMGIGLLVLLSERLVRLLDVTMGKKNSFGVVFELLGYLVPHYLGLAIPAALFLGLLFGFNKMSKDSEIDAFLSAGIGMHRLARPVAALAAVLMLAAFVIFGWLQPHTRYAYRALLFSIKNVEIFYLAEEGVFMQAGTRTFILDKLERSNNTFERIFLFDYRGPNGAETVTAANGSLLEAVNDPRPVLRLETGHRLKVDGWPEFDSLKKPPGSTSGDFDRVDTPLGRASGKIFRPRGFQAREMTLPELASHYSAPPPGSSSSIAEIRTEMHKRLVSVVTLLILPFLALPFSMGTRRGQRAYRFAVALILLVAYHEVIQQGAVSSRIGGPHPAFTMWLPASLLAIFAGWRFWNLCFRLSKDRLQPIYDQMSEIFSRLRSTLAQHFGIRA